jgi:hypothetical protein
MATVIGINGGAGKSNLTVQAVAKALDNWCDWAPYTTRGVLTPFQFLALVLWVIQTEATNSEDEAQIVNGWAKALLNSLSTIPALHPVTLLALDSPPLAGEWVLSIAHAQEFLDSMPIGFNLDVVLEHFRTEAAKLAVSGSEGSPYASLIASRKGKGKSGERWTPEQVQIAINEVKSQGIKKVAADLGIARQTLETALKRDRNKSGPEKRVNFHFRALAL